MPIRYTIAFLFTCLLAAGNQAFAESSILNDKIIESWISSQKALQAWGDKHAEVLDKYENDPDDPMDHPSKMTVERMVKPLKQSGLYGEAKSLLKDYDFSSPEQWAEVTLKIVKSAAVIQMGPEQFQMPPDMKEMLDSPHVPEEQKKMIREMMDQSLAMMKSFTEGITEADQAAVKPHLERIQQAMEEGDNGPY